MDDLKAICQQGISIHALREEGDSSPAQRRKAAPISIHALREEGDSFSCQPCCRTVLFLSTPSARRATTALFRVGGKTGISIHALREEGDTTWFVRLFQITDFYPRPPRGGRLHAGGVLDELELFLSTPSARRATELLDPAVVHLEISIHALREEGDATPLLPRS